MSETPFLDSPSASARILVVEDEPVIAADIAHTLTEAGHHIVGIAGTASEAYAQFLEHQPDLVLADLQLADGSSGRDAVWSMLKVRNVPTVFATAFPERLLTDKRPEPTFLLTKPFQPATLAAAVTRALTGKLPTEPTPGEALRFAAAQARQTLEKLAPEEPFELRDIPLGHNGPPAEQGLPYNDFTITIEILHRLEKAPETPPPDPSALCEDRKRLSQSATRIAEWVASRVADGFLTRVGENLADIRTIIGLWLIASGALERVVSALVIYLGAG
ncbi:MAG: response regulator [Phenylobacterium sp.]|uniref:response regulator n=1 Tax=Phenylobacterium sp. TaxID=1871053 RepID=UPI0039199D1F